MNDVLLQTCPICLSGPVVQRQKSTMLGLISSKQYVCEECRSVLAPLKGGRYRYTAISGDHPQMEHLRRTIFDSLDELGALARRRTEEQRARDRRAAEEEARRRLQPKTLDRFLGQRSIKERLAVSIQAATARADALGHILLCGPEGCGKNTLAHVVANEMGAQTIWVNSATEIEKPYQLTNWWGLQERDVVFVGGIDRLRSSVVDFLCKVLMTFMIAELPLPRFTLIGATSQPNRVSPQLRRCFHHIYEFEPYDDEALGQLVMRRAEVLGADIQDEACWEIGRGAKGAIREAERLLDRARDYAEVRGEGVVTLGVARWAVHGTAPPADQREHQRIGLTWQEFEDFVATLFESLGYQNVRVTPRTGDEGKDIEMEWVDPLRGTRRLYVECKHWQSNSVGRREVQLLHSAVMANPQVDEGIIVTTGGFTDGASDYAKQVGVIQLIDRAKLRALMAKADMPDRDDPKTRWRRIVGW